jgi:CubicO group peptidase (beta-lactamase class C family)
VNSADRRAGGRSRPIVTAGLATLVLARAAGPGGARGGFDEGAGRPADLATGAEADALPDTIVEIGSITKVFTTALLAGAVDADRLRPGTPLQLADFTSGMPTLPGDLPRPLAERGVRTCPPEAFLAWVSRWSPEGSEAGGCALPAPYRYSNAGIGLLGYGLSERPGAPWESLMPERITGPLGMTSTAVTAKPTDRERLAQGHGTEGQPSGPGRSS